VSIRHRVLAVLGAGLLVLGACAGVDEQLPAGQGRVVRVVDGDTLVVHIAGADERVRLLGIDTPESVAPDRPVECFGKEASGRTAQLLPPGTVVRLERDVEARDRYRRLLAYVTRVDDDTFVNLALLEEGFADVLVIEPNGAHAAAFAVAMGSARDAGRGMWGACAVE
jgi:micrococcal nuclease